MTRSSVDYTARDDMFLPKPVNLKNPKGVFAMEKSFGVRSA